MARTKRSILALLLAVALLLPALPITAAEGGGVCTHVHGADCAYVVGAACAHSHDAACGYTAAVPCNHQHDAACGAEGETCAHAHGADCGYTAGAPCGHAHDAAACGYIAAVACNHQHDAACGGLPLAAAENVPAPPAAPEITFTIPEDPHLGRALYLNEGVPVSKADLLAGVTAVDETGAAVAVTIQDMAGLDGLDLANPAPKAAPYIITYTAEHPITGDSFTEQRECHVTAAMLAPLGGAGNVPAPPAATEITFTIPEDPYLGPALYLDEGVPVTEADLLAGVTAVDETGAVVAVTIQDMDGLDLTNPVRKAAALLATPYVITYAAKHPATGDSFTEQRECHVEAAMLMQQAAEGTYNTGDIAAINAMIAKNGLNWTPAPADGSAIPSDWSNVLDWTDSPTDKRVTQFPLPGKSLAGVLDLSALTELTVVDVAQNSLTGLNVSGLKKLTNLSCYQNDITTITLGDNTVLNYIICNDNSLTTIDLSGCPNLKTLLCSNNNLIALNVSQNPLLINLGCYNNSLAALDLSLNTALTKLECYNNSLTALDVSNCPALTLLHCYDNKLTALDLSNNRDLKELICYKNSLTTLDVSNCSALTLLQCFDNSLTALDVSDCSALTRFACYNNKLTALDLSMNGDLRILTCYNNKLTALDVPNNPALTDLSCSGNELTALDLSMSRDLKVLTCNNNKLTALDLSLNTALTDLSCYNNELTALDLSMSRDLKVLACNNNKLTALDLSLNTALTDLSCYNNELTALDLSLNTALTDLLCHNNPIAHLKLSDGYDLTVNIAPVGSGSNILVGYDHGTKSCRLKTTANGHHDFINWTASGVVLSGATDNPVTFTLPKSAVTVTANYPLYHADDVAAVNAIIDKNGLNWTKDDPASWSGASWFEDGAYWRIGGLEMMNGNMAGELDLSAFPALAALLCDNNSLTALDVSNNPELLYLGCGNNKLTALDVSQNTKLKNLGCGNNDLTALDVSQNTKLTGFTCGNNPISHLKISGGYELTVNINPAASGSVMLTDYTHFTKSCTFSAAPGGANTFSGWTYSGFSKNPSASSNPVSFNLPASAVTVTANFAPPVKTVSVGAQTGALTAGSAGSATFAVTTANIADGTYPVTLNGAPTGVTAGSIDISGNRGTLTLSTTAATPQNRHPVTITIGGTTSGSFDLVVSAPGVVSVSGITVSGLGGARAITTNGGTLQMLAAVSPANATNAAVTWSVIPGTGSATIGSTGLLTATGNGTVWVRATAQDGSGVQAQLEVTISGQTVPPTQYPLIVTKGTGGGNYASGVVITITANAAPSGQVFDKWTSVGGGKFANANSATTTFTMPANAATVTATYKASGGPGPVYTDASMTPSSAVYDKYDSSANHKSVTVTLNRGSYSLSRILYGGTVLVLGTDYTVSGSQYTFQSAYLDALPLGTHGFVFVMSGGKDPVLSIQVTDTTPEQGGDGDDQDTGIYTSTALTDPDTGVSVTGLFTEGATLVVKERLLHPSGSCEVCDDIRARSEAGELIVLYDISISGGYRGDVTVTIPVGEAYNGQSLTVIHCSDKTLEEKTFTVMDGKVSGVFSGLSPFGVLKPTSNDHNPDAGGDFDAPQTKDPGYRPRRWLWALIPAVLLIGDIGIVIWRWRKSRA